jgi:hypothetical protein
MNIDWIKKRWFLVVFAMSCLGVLLGGARWVSEVDSNVKELKASQIENKGDLTKRLDRIESKLDRLIERTD